MCTWTPCVGEGDACPVLMETGRRVERLWSGCYSGIVTLDARGFHPDKDVGPLERLAPIHNDQRWVAETNARCSG